MTSDPEPATPAIEPERRRKGRLLELAEYRAYRFLVNRVAGARAERVRWWGRQIGWLASRVLIGRNRLALANLRLTFPGKSEKERSRILARCWQHFGEAVLDFVRVQTLPFEDLVANSSFGNRELFDRALAKGRGVILISGHFGNWEVAGQLVSALGVPVVTVARPLDNTLLERDLKKIRGRSGVEYVDRKKAARPLVRALERKQVVALLPDQAVKPKEGIVVPFLGRPAWTTDAPAKLALRFRSPILFLFTTRAGSRYLAQFETPIDPEELSAEDSSVQRLTGTINDVFSARILREPELWLWMHDRWKRTDES
ncbi:MAG: lysophospholipid acyltransferase family protein [Acidobacteriota bacterium]